MTTTLSQVPFGDLKRHYEAHRALYDRAVSRVLGRGWFILGQELQAFEEEFAAWCGAPYCVGCGSGTEAIALALRASGIEEGERVITQANTCVPTAVGITLSGGRLGLCDADEKTALLDADALDEQLKKSPARAVVPVHLYGQPADLDRVREVAENHGAFVVEDAAQAHGALYKGRRIGSHGLTTCWSFYPSKNLGAFGDAGAVTTHDAQLAERMRKLRNYGQETRYKSVVRGTNSRMDEMQAAVLRTKLAFLETWNESRRAIARRYREEIRSSAVECIGQRENAQGCEHLFVVRSTRRQQVMDALRHEGVETQIHYPIALHQQPAYSGAFAGERFASAEKLCSQVFSLPMFPELTEGEVTRVIEAVNRLG